MALNGTRDMVPRIISMPSAVTALVACIAGRFSRLLNCACRLTKRDGTFLTTKEIGDLGERIACAWLRAHGCKVLYRNFRGPKGGELDIVARDGKVLAFVEVSFLFPFVAHDFLQQQRIDQGR